MRLEILSLSSSAVEEYGQTSPFPSCPKQVCLKSKMKKRRRLFQWRNATLHRFHWKLPLLWRHLYLAKVRSINSCKKGSIDWAFTRDPVGTKPFSRSDGSERHSRSFDTDNSIDPKARNSLVQPPVDHLAKFLQARQGLPIEVWLVLWKEWR